MHFCFLNLTWFHEIGGSWFEIIGISARESGKQSCFLPSPVVLEYILNERWYESKLTNLQYPLSGFKKTRYFFLFLQTYKQYYIPNVAMKNSKDNSFPPFIFNLTSLATYSKYCLVLRFSHFNKIHLDNDYSELSLFWNMMYPQHIAIFLEHYNISNNKL